MEEVFLAQGLVGIIAIIYSIFLPKKKNKKKYMLQAIGQLLILPIAVCNYMNHKDTLTIVVYFVILITGLFNILFVYTEEDENDED